MVVGFFSRFSVMFVVVSVDGYGIFFYLMVYD